MNARRHSLLLITAWIACVPHCLALSPLLSKNDSQGPVRDLVDQLTADNFVARDKAMQQLENYGPVIRPALLEACRRDRPLELRWRAALLLCAISWSQPSDAPIVRETLVSYCSTDAERRKAAAAQLGVIGEVAFDALMRLLVEEPDDDVRWTIVRELRRFDTTAERERMQHLEAAAEDPLQLAAAGWAWQVGDAERGMKLLRRAADLAATMPIRLPVAPENNGQPIEPVDPHEFMRLLGTLYENDLNVGDYDDAILRLRQMVMHEDRPLSEAMLDIMALHCEYGPCKGFADDLRLAEQSFYSPEMMYVIGRLHARQNRPLMAAACYQAAGTAGLSSQDTHRRVAKFLDSRHWFDLSEVECRWVLATDGPMKLVGDAEAKLFLAHAAAARGEETQAAEFIGEAISTIHKAASWSFTHEPELRSDIDWHYLRAAKQKKDLEEIGRLSDRLLEQLTGPERPANSEILIDVVTALQMLDRHDDADAAFERQFREYKRELKADPRNPVALNNIAWFCARCGRHEEEAYGWATQAVKMGPKNAAHLDTAAEAAARVGHWDEAARLETDALKLQPGDWFMMAQLTRFKDGMKQK